MEQLARSPRQLGDFIQRYRKAKGLTQTGPSASEVPKLGQQSGPVYPMY